MAELVGLLTPILWHTVRAQRLDRESAEDVVQIDLARPRPRC